MSFAAEYIFYSFKTQVNRLLEYRDWLPIERYQISFYCNKLCSLSEAFTNLPITYEDDYKFNLSSDSTLRNLVSDILESCNNVTSFDPPHLTPVGDRLAFLVAAVYNVSIKYSSIKASRDFASEYFYFDRQKFQPPHQWKLFCESFDYNEPLSLRVGESFVYHQSLSSTSWKSTVDDLFDILLKQVDRLVRYPDWLPIQRCQICFYSQKLSFLSKQLQTRIIIDKNYSHQLKDKKAIIRLVSEILFSKDVATFNPDDLTRLGNLLALEVALIYKSLMHDSTDFTSQFYFDKNKYQEYEGEVSVGFQVEASNLLLQLVSITKKQLQVISIVGMAGLGKTTLARRLHDDPYVVSYFYVRAWVTCSQDFQKRDVLLTILSFVTEITDEVCSMNDSRLAHNLYHALMDRRYLIVIDDIWSTDAWDDLKSCFPDDNNGSKIMLTTRLKDIALHAQPDKNPLCLSFLTEDESFDLFRRKAFLTGNLSDDLSLIGKRITRKCGGLPLAIVAIAGLLNNNFEKGWWEQVEDSVSSYIASDESQYMSTLALSYNNLPRHLKPCFLSLGAFSEDHEIPVRELIWLWIAEGFIHHDGTNSLEYVAEKYLLDLVRRSLVVVGKRGSNGAIKACRIHDLFRDLCLRKVEEHNFSPDIYRYNKHSYSCPHSLTNPSMKSQLFLGTNHIPTIPLHCSSCISEVSSTFFKDLSIVWDTSKIIRTLDISSIDLFIFPTELLQLVHLRYLKLRFRSGNPPESISLLGELQTLIMSSKMSMVVPNNMWKILNLKHLCIKSGENLVSISNVEEEPSLLENLQTMSLVSPARPCQNILARTHNLQKLGLCGPLTTKSGDFHCPDLGFLMHLETLKLLNTLIPLCKAGRLSTSFIFPESLKNLTMSNTYLDWKEAWVFEMIPHLEVLKLKLYAFVGKNWETNPEAFPRLKFLKLDELDIETWTASRNHFPVLQRLQVYQCTCLNEIPDDFGNIFTLESIELSGCSDAAANSARDIQKEQESYGNDSLKILLKPGLIPS